MPLGRVRAPPPRAAAAALATGRSGELQRAQEERDAASKVMVRLSRDQLLERVLRVLGCADDAYQRRQLGSAEQDCDSSFG